MSNKRCRTPEGEDALAAALEFGGILKGRGPDVKLRALDRLLIDHGDDVYTNQKIFVDGDAAFHLVELLDDESAAVSVRAATLIALITDHSAAAKVRLQSGPLIGLENHVGRILLNPVQGDFIEAGAIEKLVLWLVGPSSTSQRSDVALSALTNMTSYNMDGKIAYLSALISIYSKYTATETTPLVVDALESVLDHIDCTHEDVVPLMNELIHPLEAALAGGSHSALSLVATLCENSSSDLTARLRAETSIVQSVAKYLIHGVSLQVQDTAARALWFLTVGDVAGVLGDGGLLGDQVGAVVDILHSLAERSVQDEAAQVARDEEMHQQRRREQQRHREELEGGSEAEEENDHVASFNSSRGDGTADAEEEEVCFAEEAKKLLEAVAKVNPHLEIKTTMTREGSVQGPNTSCIVM